MVTKVPATKPQTERSCRGNCRCGGTAGDIVGSGAGTGDGALGGAFYPSAPALVGACCLPRRTRWRSGGAGKLAQFTPMLATVAELPWWQDHRVNRFPRPQRVGRQAALARAAGQLPVMWCEPYDER